MKDHTFNIGVHHPGNRNTTDHKYNGNQANVSVGIDPSIQGEVLYQNSIIQDILV